MPTSRAWVRVEAIGAKLDEPLQVTVERPPVAGYRRLFAPTEPTPDDAPPGAGDPT